MRIIVEYAVNTGIPGDYDGKYYREIACDSSEESQIDTSDLADGSIEVQTDSGKVKFFNEKTGAFVEQFSFQG